MVYIDVVIDDGFYIVGEGIKGIIVMVVDIINSVNVFIIIIFDVGGYSLDVDLNVIYDVIFFGDLD